MSRLTAELRPHPTSPSEAIRRIGIEIDDEAFPRALWFRFRVEGDIGRIRLPAPGFARRSDGLWQHTCFEAFLRPDASESYHEFNFAPSGDWAAYRFGSRRAERTIPELPAPAIAFDAEPSHCSLSAEIPVAALPGLASASSLQVAVSAVVAAADGRLSYWALAHGGERPDFHDPAGFTLRVGRA
ncbi:MAG TPA: DOMON-like domain-containing protein [Steroidobacteraceae bacterium]|nr:DOMON-like domain-containing protein [Steroidobacteraceae bacterium]